MTDVELIHEAGVLRDQRAREAEATGYELLSRDLQSLVFERTQNPDPPALLARLLGHGPESNHTDSDVEDILHQVHLRFGIAGEIHALGNGQWYYRWRDRA